MTFRRSLLLAALAAALAPAAGHAADVRVVARDVPLGAGGSAARPLPARSAPLRFDLVGLHWRGSGRVWFRTASAGGNWSSWQPARPEAEDRPDRGTVEAAAEGGWKLGNPYWTGAATRIQYRLAGRVTRLRAFFISSPVERVPRAVARAGAPAVIRRSEWGADESIVRARPSLADSLRLAVVHHTAGTNSYSRSQSAAIVRGIQRYHVLSNGWNDIGYNFLVDKYGQVFEGRGGGLASNVVGAHAQGFNTGSVGVAVLGTYSSAEVPSAGRSALVKLLAWRLDVGHVDPASTLRYVSYGNERFGAGTAVRLRAVSGHRDTGSTSCPGSGLYGQLPGIASAVASTGLPKLYGPEVEGSLGTPVRFTARLSASASWSVTVENGSGAVVARGSGRGTAVDWTWDSSAAPYDLYSYTIAAGASTRPASGRVPGPPPLALSPRVTRTVITPNGDGSGETMRLSLTPTVRATVTATIENGAGSTVRTLLANRVVAAGTTVRRLWRGTRDNGTAVPDGSYRIRISATAGQQQVEESIDLLVDRTLGSLTATELALSPDGDGVLDDIGFAFALARSADVRVHVLRGATRVKRIFLRRDLAAGSYAVRWDGMTASGRRAPDGAYRVRVKAVSSLGTRELFRSFVVDSTDPRVRIVRARAGRVGTTVRFVLSEPASLRIRFMTGVRSEARTIQLDRGTGSQRVWRRIHAKRVRIVARDAAGNVGRAAARSR